MLSGRDFFSHSLLFATSPRRRGFVKAKGEKKGRLCTRQCSEWMNERRRKCIIAASSSLDKRHSGEYFELLMTKLVKNSLFLLHKCLPTFPHTEAQQSRATALHSAAQIFLNFTQMENEFSSPSRHFHIEKVISQQNYLMPASRRNESFRHRHMRLVRAEKATRYKIRYDRNRKHRNRNNWIGACTKEINRAMVKFMYFSPQPRDFLSLNNFHIFFSLRLLFSYIVSLANYVAALTKQFHFQYETISER